MARRLTVRIGSRELRVTFTSRRENVEEREGDQRVQRLLASYDPQAHREQIMRQLRDSSR